MKVKQLIDKDADKFGWLDGLKERHGDDVEVSFTPFDIKSAAVRCDDGTMNIPGMASTHDKDRENEIIRASAYASSLKTFMGDDNAGLLLLQHGWSDMPLGTIKSAEIRDNGLWIDPYILPTTAGKDAMICVEAGALKYFSVGFRVLADEWDEETKIRHITDLELLEVSVVNIPANPFAQFDKAERIEMAMKSLIKRNIKAPQSRKVNRMPDQKYLDDLKKVESRIGKWTDTDTTIADAIKGMNEKQESLIKLVTTVETEAEKLKADNIPLGEFNTFRDKIKGDIQGLVDDLQTANTAIKLQARRMPVTHWKQLVQHSHKDADIVFLRNDNGLALPEMQQRSFALFGVPVETDTSEGQELKLIKDLHDALYIMNYAKVKFGNPAYNIRLTKEYGWLKTLVERHDPVLAKAMYSTGAGVGDEWVPTVFSSQLEDLQRLTPGLEELFTSWDMPSNPATWPIKTGGATAVRFTEAESNNPPEQSKTQFATGNVTFNTVTIGAVLPVSAELMEDSIIDMAGEIRSELAYAITKGIDSTILNGSTAATHPDTQDGWTSASPESSWLGLRHEAVARSTTFSVQSGTAGVGDGATTFGAGDVRYNRTLLGVLGERPEQLVHITSIDVWFQIMSFTQVASNAQNQNPSTWQTGLLPAIDGIPIRVTSELVQTFHTDGVHSQAGATSVLVTVNHRKWKMGSKRGYTLEYDKNIRTQGSTFVLSTRKDFKKMAPTATAGAAMAINIP